MAGDFSPWTVYYKAVADFSDLLKEAAKARAEMAALTKDIDGMSKGLATNLDKATTAESKFIRSITAEAQPLNLAAVAARNYNRWVLWGGRDNADAYQRDLQREATLLGLLNRARQRGFYTPLMDYAFRQREYQQLLLYNRASLLGYNNPEQYMNYQQTETKLLNAQAQAWKRQGEVIAENTAIAEKYAQVTGRKISVTQDITGQTDAARKLVDALGSVPDRVQTKFIGDSLSANVALDAYQLNLSETPGQISTVADFNDAVSMQKISAFRAALGLIPKDVDVKVNYDYTAARVGPTISPGGPVPHQVVPGALPPETLRVNEDLTRHVTTFLKTIGPDATSQLAAYSAALAKARTETSAFSDTAKMSQSMGLAEVVRYLGQGTDELAAYSAALTDARAQEQALGTEAVVSAGELKKMADAAGGGDGGAGIRRAWGGGWGWLGGQLTLFGGAFAKVPLIGAISWWHLLGDAVIEFAAVAVPAAARALGGLAAYAVAAAQTFAKAFAQMRSQFTVTGATGFDLPPFAVNKQGQNVNRPTRQTRLDIISAQVRPMALSQLGMAVEAMHTQSSLISQLATSTGGVLDRFSAKLVYDFQHNQGALHTFFAVGARDLEQFGKIAQAFGSVFLEFVKASQLTHVAEDLLAVAAGVAQVAASFAHLIGPVGLAALIGTHAALVYGGLLVTGFRNLALAMTPALDLLAKFGGPFSKIQGLSFGAARGLGATDEQLAKIAAKSPGMKDAAEAAGMTATQLGSLQVQADKSGTSIERLAMQTGKGQGAVSRFGQGLDEAGKSTLAMAAYAGASDEKLSGLGSKLRGAGGDAVKFDQYMGRLSKTTSGARSALTDFLNSPTNKLGVWTAAIGASAVVYAFLADKILTATDRTDRFIAAISQHIASASLPQLLGALGTGLGQVASKMPVAAGAVAKFNSAIAASAVRLNDLMPGLGSLGGAVITHLASGLGRVGPALGDVSKALGDSGGHLSFFQKAAHSVTGVLAGLIPGLGTTANRVLGAGAAGAQASHDYAALANRFVGLSQQTVAFTQHATQLGALFGGDISKGLGAATQAGLTNTQMMSRNTKVWGEAMIQVRGLIAGYKLFGQQAGALGNDINVVTYAQSNQLKQMQALNQAWDTFTANVAGPRTTFISFAESLQTFNHDAKASGASMSGLGSAALTLQGDFQSTYTSANALLDSLRLAGVPAKTFTAVTKEMVQGLLPMAQHSKAARAEISVLAQEAGGPASHSLKTLSEWAGKTQHPIGAMQAASNKAVIAMSHLSKEAQLVSTAINSYFVQALTVAELKARKFPQAVNAMVTAQEKFGSNSVQFQDALRKVNDIMQNSTKAAQAAANAHEGLGNTIKDQAVKIQATDHARQALLQDLQNQGITATRSQKDLGNYTDAVLTNTLHTSQGQQTRAQMITDLRNQGMSAQDANRLVDAYTAVIRKNQTASQDAHATRQQMVDDFIHSGKWSNQAKFDLNAYTIMVEHNKQTTEAGRTVRQHLINDLEKTGLNAKQARRLVDELTGSIRKIPSKAHTSIGVDGKGFWKVLAHGTSHQIGQKIPGAAQGAYIDRQAGGHIDMTAGPTIDPYTDTVDAKLRPGEYVVKTEAVQKYGRGTFEALNNMRLAQGGHVPQHFAFGGQYENPLRRASVFGERIDMGVDYGGSGPLMFVGPGRVTSTFNSGWPGGAFIAEQLTAGPYAGRYIYEAEDISPSVRVGQMVGPNTVAGRLHGQMEIGWAAPPGTGETMAARFGQQSHSGDPGGVETAFGANFNQFMRSLGAIGGIGHGAISGTVPKNFGSALCAPTAAAQVPPVTGSWRKAHTTEGLGRWADHMWDKTQDAIAQQVVNDIVAAMSCGAGGVSGPQDLHGLEQLWIGAGGPGGMTAHIAAAIAKAESGGNPQARNPSGASGLWQILGQVVPGNIFNPQVNAENAVKKWRDARARGANGFSPWVTYTDGAYRHYMAQGGIISGAGGAHTRGAMPPGFAAGSLVPPGPFSQNGPDIRDPKPFPGGTIIEPGGRWAKAPGRKSVSALLGSYLDGHDSWIVRKFGRSTPLPRGYPYWQPKAYVDHLPVANPGGPAVSLPGHHDLLIPPTFHGGGMAGAGPVGMALGGLLPQNYQVIGSYLMSHGYDKIAAAGVLGNIFQESGGNPEAGGPGNAGLIQWTPGSKARPLQPIMTGHPQRDLQTQLVDLLAWNRATTSLPVLNRQKTPQAAALYYMNTAERPGIPRAATREASAAAVYRALHGAKVSPGGPNLHNRGRWATAPGRKSLTALLGSYLDSHDKWLVKKYGRSTALPKGTRYWEPADFVAHQAHPAPSPVPGGNLLGKPLPPGSNLDLGQQWQHNWDLLQMKSAVAERSFNALDHAMFPGKWFHSKAGLPTWRALMQETAALKPPVNTWATAWGDLASDRATPDLMTQRKWAATAIDAQAVQKAVRGSKHLAKYAVARYPQAVSAASALGKAYGPAYKSWLALYGPTGRDRPLHFPATPRARLIEFAHPVPTPNIAALLPALPQPSFAGGGLVGMGAGIMGAGLPGYAASPVQHRADGGMVSVPETPRAMSAGAQAAGGDRVGMQINGGITINNPVQEKAGESLTRSVNRLAFLAGRGAV